MPRMRTSMKKIREVLRLKKTTDLSDRQIAGALGISRPVVAKYWKAFTAAGLDYGQIGEMADSTLIEALEKPHIEASTRYRQLSECFPSFVLELRRTGVTLQLLWEEYKAKHADGFEYSQFCYHFQMWRDSSDVRMHINHKAGDKVFVDYAGKKLAYTDPDTGKEVPVEVFVAVLGSSGLTYAEGSLSQEKDEWIRSNERAFRYYGGSTNAVVPDNLRSAVNRADRYDPEINPDYAEFAEHYNTVIIPARVRKARDKALVEGAVLIVYRRIYARLRNRSFSSLESLNEAIWELLEEHNSKPFQRLSVSRRDLFEAGERDVLHPLPSEWFPQKTTKIVTVQFNYHVELREDRHYYSVPHYLYRKEPKTKAKLVFDDRVVSIYYDNVRIAAHRRDRSPNGYTTLPDHMPDRHRAYAEWSPERLLSWARSVGGEVSTVINSVLESRKHPEQAYRVCLGILNLAKKYGDQRLNRVCRRANEYGTSSLARIEQMIKLDIEDQEKQQKLFSMLPEHENIRGAEYYH